MSSKKDKYGKVIDQLVEDFWSSNRQKLKQEEGEITQDFISRHMMNSTRWVSKLVGVNKEYLRQLVENVIERLEKDFPRISPAKVKDYLCKAVEAEYKKLNKKVLGWLHESGLLRELEQFENDVNAKMNATKADIDNKCRLLRQRWRAKRKWWHNPKWVVGSIVIPIGLAILTFLLTAKSPDGEQSSVSSEASGPNSLSIVTTGPNSPVSVYRSGTPGLKREYLRLGLEAEHLMRAGLYNKALKNLEMITNEIDKKAHPKVYFVSKMNQAACYAELADTTIQRESYLQYAKKVCLEVIHPEFSDPAAEFKKHDCYYIYVGAHDLMAECLFRLAIVREKEANLKQAIGACEDGLRLANAQGHFDAYFGMIETLMLSHTELGRATGNVNSFEEAVRIGEDSLDRAKELVGRFDKVGFIYLGENPGLEAKEASAKKIYRELHRAIGGAYVLWGKSTGDRDHVQAGLKKLEEANLHVDLDADPVGFTEFQCNLATSYLDAYDALEEETLLSKAKKAYETVLEVAKSGDFGPLLVVHAKIGLATVYKYLGEHEDKEKNTTQALRYFGEAKEMLRYESSPETMRQLAGQIGLLSLGIEVYEGLLLELDVNTPASNAKERLRDALDGLTVYVQADTAFDQKDRAIANYHLGRAHLHYAAYENSKFNLNCSVRCFEKALALMDSKNRPFRRDVYLQLLNTHLRMREHLGTDEKNERKIMEYGEKFAELAGLK